MTAVAGYDVGVKQQTPFFYNILFFFTVPPNLKMYMPFFLAGALDYNGQQVSRDVNRDLQNVYIKR